MVGLRERQHIETKEAIRVAAFQLFDEIGFANTTMEQIADRSEVSRSTAYRRFASKEDIVLEVPRRWLASWDMAIGSLDDETSLADALSLGCLAVAAEIDSDPELVLAAYRALSESPILQSSGAASTEWLQRMAALVANLAPGLEPFETLTIAGAYMGAIDTMMLGWAMSGGVVTVTNGTSRVLDRLSPILP